MFQSNLCILNTNIQMPSIINIRFLVAELLHADERQADVTKIFAILRMSLKIESV